MSRKKDFNFDEMLGMSTGGSTNVAGNVEQSVQAQCLSEVDHDGEDLQKIIADLLAAHVGLRTGFAKKTTFDFTPEFARALKKWSVDVDTPMRDLVVKAVAQVIPIEYIQKTRNTGMQEYRNK